jgi:2'-5' RNA ligase
LWLLPEAAVEERLTRCVAELASRQGTPPFSAHVTLLAGIPAARDEVLVGARELARQLMPIPLKTKGFGGEDDYFRSFFLSLELSPRLREARRLCGSLLDAGHDQPFEPHLSLVYGRLEDREKAGLADELRDLGRLLDATSADRIGVVVTEGPVSAWIRIATLPLG